jgi:hypothetical protein
MTRLDYLLRKESEYECIIVEILKDQPLLNLKKGHWYRAKRYWIDPEGCTLVNRVSKTGRHFKKNPMCYQYMKDVREIKKIPPDPNPIGNYNDL